MSPHSFCSRHALVKLQKVVSNEDGCVSAKHNIRVWLSFTVGDSVPAFRVKLGTNDLNCVDVPLNPTPHSLTFHHQHWSLLDDDEIRLRSAYYCEFVCQ